MDSHMKRRPILIALAVLLALIGTGAVYVYVHSADSRAVNGMRATTVLVATKQIPVGTPWSQVASGGYVSTESVPASAAPATALSSTSANIATGYVATYSIAPGQIVVREAFGQQPASTGVLTIPGTLQAVTISVPANADVAGYVQPNSQVAVYSVNQIQKSSINNQFGGTPYVSKLLLPRVKVIAVSAAAPTSTNGTGAGAAGTVLVTLALNQQQAERVVLAQKLGDLYLGLLTDASVSTDGDGGILGAGVIGPNLLFPR
jgi:pilus assembly protein CpaB